MPHLLRELVYKLTPSWYQALPPSWRFWLLKRLTTPTKYEPHFIQREKQWRVWPQNKKYAVLLTHDVDTDYCFLHHGNALLDLEQQYGFKSTWFLVASKLQQVMYSNGARILLSKGQELGCHGWVHKPNFADRPPSKVIRELGKCELAFSNYLQYRPLAFRAPFLSIHASLYSFLGQYFQYDMSYHTNHPYPFIWNYITEIPLSIPDDATLLANGYSPKEILDLWLEYLEEIKRMNGVAVISIHPEPQFGLSKGMIETYEPLLSHLANDTEVLVTTPSHLFEELRVF